LSNKIQTKPYRAGDEKEASWPPLEGTYDTTPVYWDSDKKKLVKGYPPQRTKEVNAPYVIGDTMPDYRHPKTGQVIDSKSKLRRIDEANGTITTDKLIPASPTKQREREYQRKLDNHNALHKAVAQLDAGTAPLDEKTRAMCDATNERISSALNMDAFNVVGRKTNAKGKKYRRR